MSQKIQHLEMIQKIIARASSNSFTMKGWAITLIVGIFVLAYNLLNKNMNYSYFFIAYIPVLFFWYLDACYLRIERQYRILYDKIREKNEEQIDFDLDYREIPEASKISFKKCFFSKTEFSFYISFIIIISFIILINYKG